MAWPESAASRALPAGGSGDREEKNHFPSLVHEMTEKRIQRTSSDRSFPDSTSRTWSVRQSAPPSERPYASSFPSWDGAQSASETEPSGDSWFGSITSTAGEVRLERK